MKKEMKKEIKIGDKTFELKIPDILDKPTIDHMNDWRKLIEHQNNDKSDWTTIPSLPQYKFKNLKIESNLHETKDEAIEMTITFKCDNFEFDGGK